MKEFLCLIISNQKEIMEMRISAMDESYARLKASDIFMEQQKYVKRFRDLGDKWYTDTCEI